MTYSTTTWIDGSTPALDAANLNKIETGIDQAHAMLGEGTGIGGPLNLVGASAVGQTLRDVVGTDAGRPDISALRWQMDTGSLGSPVTLGQPNIKVSRVENISSGTMPNPSDSPRCAAIYANVINLVTSTPQAVAVAGEVYGGGTTSGSDLCALWGVALAGNTGATGVAMGAYLEGRRDVNTAYAFGAEITAFNNTATNGTYLTDQASRTVGIWLPSRGLSGSDNACGIQIGSLSGSQFKVGIGINSDAVADASFRDDSSSATSILVNGSHSSSISVEAGAGPVRIGLPSTNIFASSLLELYKNGSANPMMILCGQNATDSIAFEMLQGAGIYKMFVAGATDSFLVGAAQGDGGILAESASKRFHLGGDASVISIGHDNSLAFRPSASQTLVAGTAILANAGTLQISAASPITSTAAPTIANGVDGQRVRVVNVGSNNITLSDQGTLASSNLRLTGTTVVVAPRQSIELTYLSSVGDWVQTGALAAVV